MSIGETPVEFGVTEGLSIDDRAYEHSFMDRAAKGIAIVGTVALLLGGCRYHDFKESIEEENAAKAQGVKNNQEKLNNKPDDTAAWAKLEDDIFNTITGGEDDAWASSVAGTFLRQLEESPTDTFEHTGGHTWLWTNAATRNNNDVSKGAAMTAEFDGETLRLAKSAKPKGINNIISMSVSVKAAHIGDQPSAKAGRKTWSNWFDKHSDDLSVDTIRANNTNLSGSREFGMVYLGINYEGSSTERKDLSGFDAYGVAVKGLRDVQVKQDAFQSFEEDFWANIKHTKPA